MKSLLILGSFLLVGIFTHAQKKTTTVPTGAVKTAPKTVVTATPTSFESSLVNGTLSFIKTFQQGDGKDFVAVYSVSKINDASFNNRKPIQISLSRQSFDSVFTKTTSDLAAKWGQMNKYIESNKVSLTNEKGWIDVIGYFNTL